jgi:hypothetical protein
MKEQRARESLSVSTETGPLGLRVGLRWILVSVGELASWQRWDFHPVCPMF